MPVAFKQAGILLFASHGPVLLPHTHVPDLHIFAVSPQATAPQTHAPLLHLKSPTQVTLAHGSENENVLV